VPARPSTHRGAGVGVDEARFLEGVGGAGAGEVAGGETAAGTAGEGAAVGARESGEVARESGGTGAGGPAGDAHNRAAVERVPLAAGQSGGNEEGGGGRGEHVTADRLGQQAGEEEEPFGPHAAGDPLLVVGAFSAGEGRG